jgi:hypothetical protein
MVITLFCGICFIYSSGIEITVESHNPDNISGEQTIWKSIMWFIYPDASFIRTILLWNQSVWTNEAPLYKIFKFQIDFIVTRVMGLCAELETHWILAIFIWIHSLIFCHGWPPSKTERLEFMAIWNFLIYMHCLLSSLHSFYFGSFVWFW